MDMSLRIVVADKSEAQMYEAATLSSRLHNVATLVNPAAHLRERDLVTDGPGRVANRAAGVGQTYNEGDQARRQVEARFVRNIGQEIARAATAGDCEGIVLVAAPRLLASIKKAVPRSAQKAIVLQIPKDLVHRPRNELGKYIKDVAAERGVGKRKS